MKSRPRCPTCGKPLKNLYYSIPDHRMKKALNWVYCERCDVALKRDSIA